MWQAEVRVDLDAIEAQRRLLLRRRRPRAEVMAVVKGDGYGHGMVPAARAALRGGATWLGGCTVDEALTLRARRASPRRCWPGCCAPGLPLRSGGRRRRGPVRGDAGAARRDRRPPRAGPDVPPAFTSSSTPACPAAGRRRPSGRRSARRRPRPQADGAVEVVGVWSHLVHADEPDHPTNDRAARGVPRRARRGRAARHHARVPAPGELGRHADPPRHPLRPGPAGHRLSTACRRCRSARTSGCGRR